MNFIPRVEVEHAVSGNKETILTQTHPSGHPVEHNPVPVDTIPFHTISDNKKECLTYPQGVYLIFNMQSVATSKQFQLKLIPRVSGWNMHLQELYSQSYSTSIKYSKVLFYI